MKEAAEIIELLQLSPLPEEGGWYRESYRSSEETAAAALPERFTSPRSVSTAIYYLLTPESFSGLHRVASDEIFHFYMGDAVSMLEISPEGEAAELMAKHPKHGALLRRLCRL